jgi:lipoprotein-anchoring transpeptidase ErfK/SrfK
LIVLSRRSFLFSIVSLAGCSGAVHTEVSDPLTTQSFTAFSDQPEISANELTDRNPELARQLVRYQGPERLGTVVVRTKERKLYYVLDEGRAIRYPVGVGRAGKQWQGRAEIDGKHVNPAWAPPEEVLHDNPRLPQVYPGGSPDNRWDLVR